MLIASLRSGGNACGENFSRLFVTFFVRQKLAIHLLSRNVVRVALDQHAKMLVRSDGITAVHAFER